MKFFTKTTFLLRKAINKVYLPGGFKVWVTLFSLSFVGYNIWLNSSSLFEISLGKLAFFWLILSLLFSLFSLFLNAFAWRALLAWLGYISSEINLIPLFLSSNLLKYLPGGIWHFVERVRVLKNYIGPGKALSSVLLEPLLMSAAALAWVPLGGWQSGIGLLCIFPSFLFIRRFREPLLRRLERTKVKQIKKIALETEMSSTINLIVLGKDDYPFKAFSIEMLFVLMRYLGFWCCVNAFSLQTNITFLDCLASFSLAWTIGLVVPAAPGGVGVFETALLIRIGSSIPEAPLLAVLISYRLIASLSDLLAASGVALSRNSFVKK